MAIKRSAGLVEQMVLEIFTDCYKAAHEVLDVPEYIVLMLMAHELGVRAACLKDRSDHNPEKFFLKDAINAGHHLGIDILVDVDKNIREGFSAHMQHHHEAHAVIAKNERHADNLLNKVCESHAAKRKG